MKQERQLLLDWYADMVIAYREKLSDEERAQLAAWEDENLGTLGTSDWPGWQKYLPKRPAKEPVPIQLVRKRA